MSIDMTPKPRRELILDAVSNLATDPLDYDRKRTSTCPAARSRRDRGAQSRKTFEAGRSRPRDCWPNQHTTVDLLQD